MCGRFLILEDGLNVQQVIRWLQEERPERFQRLPKSRNTVFAAIDHGLIPGVTRDTLKTKTVRLFFQRLDTYSAMGRQGNLICTTVTSSALR